jgi:hypothetical protein
VKDDILVLFHLVDQWYEVLYKMMSCTSDHHPVKIILSIDISEKAIEHKNDTNQINPNIKWDKVDQDLYIAMINEGVEKILRKDSRN